MDLSLASFEVYSFEKNDKAQNFLQIYYFN
jgi:hypothetical protein